MTREIRIFRLIQQAKEAGCAKECESSKPYCQGTKGRIHESSTGRFAKGSAKRRLDFSLQQSCIFSHFGELKEDEAKHQTKVGGATYRRHEEDAEGTNTTYGLDADEL